MKYKDAYQIIIDNGKTLHRHTLNSNPPHSLLCMFIAPSDITPNDKQLIFERCFKGESNETVLEDLHLLFNINLIPYVAIKIWGNSIVIPIDSYLNSTLNN